MVGEHLRQEAGKRSVHGKKKQQTEKVSRQAEKATTGERGSVWMNEGREKRAPRTSVWEQVWQLKHR